MVAGFAGLVAVFGYALVAAWWEQRSDARRAAAKRELRARREFEIFWIEGL